MPQAMRAAASSSDRSLLRSSRIGSTAKAACAWVSGFVGQRPPPLLLSSFVLVFCERTAATASLPGCPPPNETKSRRPSLTWPSRWCAGAMMSEKWPLFVLAPWCAADSKPCERASERCTVHRGRWVTLLWHGSVCMEAVMPRKASRAAPCVCLQAKLGVQRASAHTNGSTHPLGAGSRV